MPRPQANGLSLAQLEHLLASRRAQIRKFGKRRAKLSRELAQIDKQIAALGGAGLGAAGGRARNEKSLVAMLEEVMGGGKPMGVGDIVAAVQKKGYRSTSANFRGIVNQTLIKEKQFTSAGRGMYQLRK